MNRFVDSVSQPGNPTNQQTPVAPFPSWKQLSAACQREKPQGTVEIRYGESACAACGAVIEDPRFAALLQPERGAVRVFDDPGCLFRAHSDNELSAGTARFRAYDSQAWLEAESTWFARADGVDSPQGFGWAAFGDFGSAQDLVTQAAGNGEILPFAKVADRIRSDE